MSLQADARHAVRLLVKAPHFTLVSLLSLAGGLAAASTIYSLADAFIGPATGVRDPARAVDIGRATEGRGFDNMSYPAFRHLRDHATTLDGMAAIQLAGRPMSLTVGRSSERVFGTVASANFFEVVGVRPALGRFFRPDEDAVPGERPVVVLTHRFWTRRFDADPAILERPLRLNNREFAVVGVAEPGFEGVTVAGTDLWVPVAMVAVAQGLETSDLLTSPRAVWHLAIGRLRAGVSEAQAHAELNTLMAQYRQMTPDANQRHTVALARSSRVPPPLRTPFFVFLSSLLALALAFTAIACSNVAGLLLARAAARRREMATRLAMGASRTRLLAQLLTESVVLFLGAGIVAVPLTVAGIRALETFLPVALPVAITLQPTLNLRVLAFGLGVTLVASLIFGLAPARHALAIDLAPLLHGATATGDRRRRWARHALVAGQVALSLMLVVTAGLFARSLQQAGRVDPGFSTTDVALANVDVSLSGYHGAAALDLITRLQARLAALPAVDSVAVSRMVPLQGSGFGLGGLRVPGYRSPQGDDRVDADWNVVSPEYFTTIDMRLVEGRSFRGADTAGAPPVAIVNEAFARLAWPGRPALGQRVLHEDDGREVPMEIVGVAATAKYRYLTDVPEPFIFVPLAQHPQGGVTFFIKHRPGRAPGAEVRAAIAQVDASVPLLFLQSFDDAAGLGLLPQRLTAWIAGAVGSVGAGLAAFGLYGLMVYLVAQRRRELAIRVALGASPAQLRGLVLHEATRLASAGALAGLALAFGIGTALKALLVGVPVVDVASYAGAAALFTATLGIAAWIPAQRAGRTDAASALRAE
jgi:predicted permease